MEDLIKKREENYETCEVDENFTREELISSYRKFCRKNHPDKNKSILNQILAQSHFFSFQLSIFEKNSGIWPPTH